MFKKKWDHHSMQFSTYMNFDFVFPCTSFNTVLSAAAQIPLCQRMLFAEIEPGTLA
jgi:hypothetical protein